jgi:hypothetical protein
VVTTNAQGIATSSTYTANGTAGSYTVTATVAGAANSPEDFTETNGYVLAINGGNNQSAHTNAAFTAPLSVLVTLNGAPVAGVSVTFAAPAAGASGTFAACAGGNPHAYSCVVTTNAQGIATSSTYTANGTLSLFGYTVTATVAGAVNSPEDFTENNT